MMASVTPEADSMAQLPFTDSKNNKLSLLELKRDPWGAAYILLSTIDSGLGRGLNVGGCRGC
jgi:hypothetical protein